MKATTKFFMLFLFLLYSVVDHTAQGFSRPEIDREMSSVENVSMRQLIENKESFLGKEIRVTGNLENIGKNYFTDLKVVLRNPDEENGDFIYVRPWLPLEFPTLPPGAPSSKRPDTLSKYLGQTVELIGLFNKGNLKHVGEVRLLEVESAKILETNE